MSIPGAFLFVFLAIVRVAGIIRGGFNLLGVLLFGQASLAALLMVFRRPTGLAAPKWVQAGAWLSAILPLLFSTASESIWQGLLPIPGLVLTLWALVSLGTTFGIAPAYRGLVTTGPYHWLRHPMYAGELLSLLGAFLGAPLPWNLIILLVFTASILWRISREESILNRNGYAAYASIVRWRLVPRVW
jgi:protein-S-isoprenylcysteine O-methyltransferase Ste14